MTALLVQAAESGMQLFEAVQGCERFRNLPQVPLAHRNEIENIPILGDLNGQRLGCAQRLRVLAGFEDLPYPMNFQFHR
jgi:hypothetical protein